MIARNGLRLVATAGLGLGSMLMLGCYGDALDGHPIKHLGTYSQDAERARLNQEAALNAPADQQAVSAGARLSDDQYRVGSPTNSPSVPVGTGGNAAGEGASNTNTVGNGTGGGAAADVNDLTINRANNGSMTGNTNTAAMPPENTAAGSVSTGSSQRTGGGATGGSGGGASGGSGGGATGGSGGGAAGGSAGKSSGGGR